MTKYSNQSRSATWLRRGKQLFAGVLLLQAAACSFAAEDAVVLPAPQQDEAAVGTRETAVFAGGCFWGVQGVFQHVAGVSEAVSGYAGGAADTARYGAVSDGDTGHAESVRVTFDPQRVSYGTLLQIFFSVAHNPTELNYQGPDHGTQYRSALFPTSAEQQRVAQAYIAQLEAAHVYAQPIVTRLEQNVTFYPAEGYHQNYLTEHPDNPYIEHFDLPKVAQLKTLFTARYQAQPVLVKGL